MNAQFEVEPFEFASETGSGLFSEEILAEAPVPNVGSPEFVRWVQRSLNQLRNSGLVVDGNMGPGTRAAIRAFQQAQGLTADGVVGPLT